MKKVETRGRKWLLFFHLFMVSAWVGAAICITLLRFNSANPNSGDELFALNSSIKLLDDFVIIPAALGTLLSGFLISLLTNWGFFKHNWVTIKWVVTVSAVLFGAFFLGPWVNSITEITDSMRILALDDPNYHSYQRLHAIFGTIQMTILIVTVFISVFKPFKKKN